MSGSSPNRERTPRGLGNAVEIDNPGYAGLSHRKVFHAFFQDTMLPKLVTIIYALTKRAGSLQVNHNRAASLKRRTRWRRRRGLPHLSPKHQLTRYALVEMLKMALDQRTKSLSTDPALKRKNAMEDERVTSTP